MTSAAAARSITEATALMVPPMAWPAGGSRGGHREGHTEQERQPRNSSDTAQALPHSRLRVQLLPIPTLPSCTPFQHSTGVRMGHSLPGLQEKFKPFPKPKPGFCTPPDGNSCHWRQECHLRDVELSSSEINSLIHSCLGPRKNFLSPSFFSWFVNHSTAHL